MHRFCHRLRDVIFLYRVAASPEIVPGLPVNNGQITGHVEYHDSRLSAARDGRRLSVESAAPDTAESPSVIPGTASGH